MSEPTCAPDLQPLLRDLHSVKRYPGNPKRHDLEMIQDSITRYGFWRAIVVQKATGYVLAGNGQHEASELLGATRVPIVEVDVDDDAAKRIVLMDNKAGDNGYEDVLLAELLKDLQHTPEGLDGTGYNNDEMDDLLDKLADDALDGNDDFLGDADEEESTTAWGVIITAGTEAEQLELLERFQDEGLNVRALIG
ncbi:ParB N-terminal domain-containing protein [Streptomyces sp. NPDC050095]|uniref:ParB N-terminal domain-containing protein n=1 Tax=unclassified Streptomyces TaxID=2593676 RepID=UPI00342D41AE